MGSSVSRIRPSKSKMRARITTKKGSREYQSLRSAWPCSWVRSLIREGRTLSSQHADRGPGGGWVGSVLSGIALVAVAVMLVVLFGFLDAIHYRSLRDFFTPDPLAA